MSRLGQQVFFARKRSVNAAAAEGFVCAKAQRQQQQDVGHEGVITGCDVLSLRSPIANPQGVAQSPLQSTYLHSIHFSYFQRMYIVPKAYPIGICIM
ncbi:MULTISPECIES: hypothetical protein [unclassified Lysinibacillus]|uniref:hypothetical protein n=1 Tax=unclassified Lysinibacillus TaxID=2636778 RepID=UPI002012EB11|nr:MULTISPECIES: hypothetical protein [unclassified Lysinibacillus]MCL1695503.1 hypothetical protein [Lysinibacillus sp. BPa_S21]MCL1700253.1 hypothetical protein [Lysinibacillus sp. Bpr_S20]